MIRYFKSILSNPKRDCPYCYHRFKKVPTRQRKCPECNETIFRKRRPNQNEPRLVTEKEAKLIDAIWSVKWKKEKRAELKLIIESKNEHLKNGRLAMYTSSRRAEAELYHINGDLMPSLTIYFEVLYLSANGVDNNGGFNLDGYLPPGNINTTKGLIDELDLNSFQAQKMFTIAATPTQGKFNPPLSPTEAWLDIIKPALIEE